MRYGFDFAPRYRAAALPFGVTERTAWIEIDSQQLRVRFGPWRFATELANIAAVSLSGPFAFVRTAGSARLGFRDRSLTFATNSRAGVLIEFVHAVGGIDPLHAIRHPNLTVTPSDPAAVRDAVQAAIV